MKNAERNALLDEAIAAIANSMSLPEAQAVLAELKGTGEADDEYAPTEEPVEEPVAEGEESEVTAEEQEEPEGEDDEEEVPEDEDEDEDEEAVEDELAEGSSSND